MDPAKHLQHDITVPRSELQPYVRHFLHTYNPSPAPYSLYVPPTGAIYLSYNFGAPQYMRFSDQVLYRLAPLFVGGQLQREMPWTRIQGHSGLAGVEFTATGFHRLFHVDCRALSDRTIAFGDLVGAREANELAAVLGKETTADGRHHWLEHYLMGKVPHAAETDRVDRAVQLIEQASGRIAIDELAERCAVSHRQLNRTFSVVVGVGPKHYAKVVQIRQVLTALDTDDQATLQELAAWAGYYDQAHFIKDFQRLVGTNPLGFLNHPDSFLKSFLTRL
ncbi:helix-turn-helix domain-containing protein [Saccharospirillum salsuginis]|uniref:HTH araC/xylS-type domain-containing protein n=1 Tax=Saccharospirillum salsuginis TaxID=418750 RepID=A0A918KMS6_9GAMM|nr:AraC family transcriptional regulator [Saccharospirillum salsuginis]GGX68887.1 hypothetical protein GCM10007392_40680 [Saccharospirillum salsuginis]